MPVLAIFTGTGITRQMYDSVRKEIRWESQHPAGAILHVASFDESGNLHVADVWESAELMDAFVKSRLVPAMQKLGVPPPNAVVFPTFNINAFSGVEKFRLR